jgi:hypothetical protein
MTTASSLAGARRRPAERVSVRRAAALSFVLTYLFFLEYLPPFQRVHVPFDLEGFHLPLFDYAFQCFRAGRFPEWDPVMYCGLSFVGNVQAALFYPPTWLIFLLSIGKQHVPFAAVEAVLFAHFWLGFMLCYAWLRGRGLRTLASALGGMVFAFSGYLLMELQHFGLIASYAWFPLGLWGIDEASQRRGWRPLWKLAVASAMCFLAGYPPTWFVFAACMGVYALFSPGTIRVALGAVAAIVFSMLLAAVQLFPGLQANSLKVVEPRYGSGIQEPAFFLSYLVPNFYNFNFHTPVLTNPGREFLYLGAPAFFGLAALVFAWRNGRRRELAAVIAMLAFVLIAVTNPRQWVSDVIARFELLSQVWRDYYFLAGITVAASLLAATGVDAFLRRPSRPAPRWRAPALIAAAIAWSAILLLEWRADSFAAGWRGAVEPAITLLLFALGMFAVRAECGSKRIAVAAALLALAACDYKAFGTSKRFNAAPGKVRPVLLVGPGDDVEPKLRRDTDYRAALDETGPIPTALRASGIASPQGWDPMITTQYKRLMERIAHFRTNWLIDIDPKNEPALRLLGVKYLITGGEGPYLQVLRESPSFRPVGATDGYHKVFELINASPTFGCEPAGACTIRSVVHTPERRAFLVVSKSGARFTLAEQFYPGWRAYVDGAPVAIERWNEAFQSIQVPAGRRRVEFLYRSYPMRFGAVVSALSALALLLAVRKFW